MNEKITTLITFLILQMVGISQSDSIAFSTGMVMEDGIYLTYSDFRKNAAINKNQIISNESKDQLEFINKTVFKGKFSYQIMNQLGQVIETGKGENATKAGSQLSKGLYILLVENGGIKKSQKIVKE